jgi:hypothetical protein
MHHTKGEIMDYLEKAKDYAVQWSVDRKGEHEFVFDQVGLEYFLDSIGFCTVDNKILGAVKPAFEDGDS